MDFALDESGQRRLSQYFKGIGSILGNHQRRASFALYAFGLLGDGERKSMEPIAAKGWPEVRAIDAAHQRLQHFITNSDWNDFEVRKYAAKYCIDAMARREPIVAWIIDDTGMLKQGSHSVGVQRQYSGSAGKVANCQLGVSLTVTTATEHVPIDFELYLPESWADDHTRRQEARIPEHVVFKTKTELAWEMIQRAIDNDIPKGVVLVDAFYGRSSDFRSNIRSHKLEYIVGVDSDLRVRPLSAQAGLSEPVRVDELAKSMKFRSWSWRDGTQARLYSRFAFKVVRLPEGETATLIAEWEANKLAPEKFYLAALDRKLSKKCLIRLLKERWRTERVYEDLKGELGFDHFEGRRWRGWHHHVSIALCCFSFIVAERVRRFSPQTRGKNRSRSLPVAA